MKYYCGQKVSIKKIITEEDVLEFAKLSGDLNPIHIDREFAEKSIFKKQVAHGMYVSSMISTLLGMYLPGSGCIYLKQTLNFLKPVYFNDELTAEVEIVDINNEIAKCKTTITNMDQEKVVEGEAVVLLPKE